MNLKEIYHTIKNRKNMKPMEEILNNQVGGTLQEKTEQIREAIDVPFSPFKIIKQGNEHFLAIAQFRVSEVTEDIDSLKTMVFERDWQLMLNVMFAVVTMIEMRGVLDVVNDDEQPPFVTEGD